MIDQIVIAGMARTPVGGFLGDLASTTAPQFGSVAVRAAVSCAKVIAVNKVCGFGMRSAMFTREAQRARLLPTMAAGRWISGFALTATQVGPDSSALNTGGRLMGDYYVIDGAKPFITSAKNGVVANFFAGTDPAADKKGMSALFAPTDVSGYEVVRVPETLGQHASDTRAPAFSGVRVSADDRLGAEGDGYKIALANLVAGWIGIAARVRLDGWPRLTKRLTAKHFVAAMATTVCSFAAVACGRFGILRDYLAARIDRDARICQIYNGANDERRLVIAWGQLW
jgi:butyryl-CoA dehydrogenase